MTHFKCPMCRYKLIVDIDTNNNTAKAYCKHCNTSRVTEFKNLEYSTKEMAFIASLQYKIKFPRNFSKSC